MVVTEGLGVRSIPPPPPTNPLPFFSPPKCQDLENGAEGDTASRDRIWGELEGGRGEILLQRASPLPLLQIRGVLYNRERVILSSTHGVGELGEQKPFGFNSTIPRL